MVTQHSTPQLDAWTSDFGRIYTDRNLMSVADMDAAFGEQFNGRKKSDIYRTLLPSSRLPNGRVLEVGCNVGLQLRMLESVRPELDLQGLEPQSYAIERARRLSPEITFHQGSAFALPFQNRAFDVVMTNGVLIHIHPDDLPRAMEEIHRCSTRFILCHEYFARETMEVKYRGNDGLLWKTDFKRRYFDLFDDLRVVEEMYLPYAEAFGGPELVDQVVLLEKRSA